MDNFQDVVNEDGTVTRTITREVTFSADQYQRMLDNKTAQIAELQSEIDVVTPNITKVKDNLSKNKKVIV
jgi:peptidoglycan hydrolase CwlO-like protein